MLVHSVKENPHPQTNTRAPRWFLSNAWTKVSGSCFFRSRKYFYLFFFSQLWGCPFVSDVYEFPCKEYDPWDEGHKEWDPSHKKYQVPIGDFCSSDSWWPVSCQQNNVNMAKECERCHSLLSPAGQPCPTARTTFSRPLKWKYSTGWMVTVPQNFVAK